MQGEHGENQWPSFYFQINELDVPRGMSPRWDKYGFWLPPLDPNHQVCTQGPVLKWNGHGFQRVSGNVINASPHFATGSLWMQTSSQKFFVLGRDPSRNDLEERLHDWELLRFHDRNNMSYVDYSATHNRLIFTGQNRWMNQLLPLSYHPPTNPAAPPGGLIGRLPLVLGLFAFSGTLGNTEAVLPRFDGSWVVRNTHQSCKSFFTSTAWRMSGAASRRH